MTDIKRNGSGYYDETPYKALFQKMIPEPGEIWDTTQGRQYLIIATHNSNLHTALQLQDTYSNDSIEIAEGMKLYTNPAMIQFMFGHNLNKCVNALCMYDFERVTDAVADSLCINFRVNKIDDTMMEDLNRIIDRQKDEIEGMRIQLDAARGMNAEMDKLKAQVEVLREERDHYAKQTEQLMNGSNDDGLYKKMYDALLDRLIQYGRA